MNKWVILLIMLVFFLGCKKEKKESGTYFKGKLTVLTDDSFKSVTEALADGYRISYPESEITIKTIKEDLGFLELLNGNAKIIVMSRDLSEKEIEEYKKQTDLEFQPAKFGADAVAFVVPADSPKQSVSLEEIKEGLMSDAKPFVFDGTNSSNLNFVAQKIGKKPSELKFSIINGNRNVIQELGKYPGKIGVIGYNTISRPYDKESENLRNKIKVLPVTENGKAYEINSENLRLMQYPFTRILYFLVNEGGFDMASGFVRYSCTMIGQKIVQKEGLQPYNMYGREVQMR
ncbi:MAG: substrate-binding domain-containing protein [Bergeyella sp.]